METFIPSRRRGLSVHLALLLLLAAGVVGGVTLLLRAPFGLPFALWLVMALACLFPILFLAYRAYALYRAAYLLDRDRLVIVWGLRREEIPISDVEWLRPVSDLTPPLRLPRWALPGSVLGFCRHPDLGRVEFLASERDPRRLLLVGTRHYVFVISPERLNEFVQAFARAMEMGMLAEQPAVSVYPSFWLGEAWRRPLVRFLWSAGFLLQLSLLIWVLLVIPTRSSISLGFDPRGLAYPPVPAGQLMLLPLESLVLGMASWLGGLYFYRWPPYRPLAMVLWTAPGVMAVFFLLAGYFALLGG